MLGMALKIGQLIVEFDLHPHRSKRLDEVRHARQHEAGTAKFKDHLRSGIEHPIAQLALKHTDGAPYSVRCSRRSPTGRVFSSNTGVH